MRPRANRLLGTLDKLCEIAKGGAGWCVRKDTNVANVKHTYTSQPLDRLEIVATTNHVKESSHCAAKFVLSNIVARFLVNGGIIYGDDPYLGRKSVSSVVMPPQGARTGLKQRRTQKPEPRWSD
jgi:hypothetical protein